MTLHDWSDHWERRAKLERRIFERLEDKGFGRRTRDGIASLRLLLNMTYSALIFIQIRYHHKLTNCHFSARIRPVPPLLPRHRVRSRHGAASVFPGEQEYAHKRLHRRVQSLLRRAQRNTQQMAGLGKVLPTAAACAQHPVD